ncbi:MAG TPA: chemotaxis protein CheW [Alphaproteobacteria bacterium]|nr:chemotaxis protein CheW [Alphaproteobacteria bacterium]
MSLDHDPNELNDVLQAFYAEADENLDLLEQDLIRLETLAAEDGSADADTVVSVLAMLQTLKGSAGFLGLGKMTALADAAGVLVEQVKTGSRALDKDVVDAMLQSIDTLKVLLNTHKNREDDGEVDDAALLAVLENLSGTAPVQETVVEAVSEPEAAEGAEPEEVKPEAVEAVPVVEEAVAEPEAEEGPQAGPLLAKTPAVRTGDKRAGEDRRRQLRRTDEEGAVLAVEIAKLDGAMTLLGELVMARNALLHQLNGEAVAAALQGTAAGQKLGAAGEEFSRLTQQLQRAVLGMRMQPVKKIFDKLMRQVADLKGKQLKDLKVITEGEMVEVDRLLVDGLEEPLSLLVAAALEHHFEPTAERKAAGKPRAGTLVLRAFYEGANMVIQVQDNGRGADPKNLNAVRQKIARLQGAVSVQAEAGTGTCVSVFLPLPLAIVNALIVGAGSEGFAVPLEGVAEVVKLEPKKITRGRGADTLEVGGKTLPLFYLGELAGAKPADGGFVVVVRENGGAMGLVVDELKGQQEVVMKNVSGMFAHHKAIAGATIAGDGRVHMIVDVPYLLGGLSNGLAAAGTA